jgi:hypothetical protein
MMIQLPTLPENQIKIACKAATEWLRAHPGNDSFFFSEKITMPLCQNQAEIQIDPSEANQVQLLVMRNAALKIKEICQLYPGVVAFCDALVAVYESRPIVPARYI